MIHEFWVGLPYWIKKIVVVEFVVCVGVYIVGLWGAWKLSKGDWEMRDIFVVAGNRMEFRHLLDYAAEQWDFEITHRMVHCVDSPWVLEKVYGARVFLYGTYHKRIDIGRIEELIQQNGHRRLLIR